MRDLRQPPPGGDHPAGHRARRARPLARAIPPAFGAWAQPGGFLQADETVIQGAVRETLEETGLYRGA